MTRPEIIRADSIDLQDRDAPSAKNHPRHPPVQSSQPTSALAPHQAETLREVAAESAEENSRSPRVSWNSGVDSGDLEQQAEDLVAGVSGSFEGASSGRSKMQQQDALAIAQNGGNDLLEDDIDPDGDEDDDMDKISSSPSIEDGGYPVSPAAPCTLPKIPFPGSLPGPMAQDDDARSSSPCLETPEHMPITFTMQKNSHRRQAESEYKRAYNHEDGSQYEGNSVDQEQRMEHGKEYDGGYSGEENFTQVSNYGWEPDQLHDCPAQSGSNAHFVDAQGGDLAVAYSVSEDGDDDDDFYAYQSDPRYCDSGWSSECLQDAEDIDFEFVYALHTFVATVEGQANATKGDTMVLLDDSNSYWWLVRVVKDSSIEPSILAAKRPIPFLTAYSPGYLPAEHIETPTERLARLNKHRNIDLSATMLGDQMEKTKNPIKSAMKRRKTKTVAFAAPTFHDYSDIDYSTEEEDPEMDFYIRQQQAQQQQEQQQQQQQQQEQQQAQQNQQQQQQSQQVVNTQAANEEEPSRAEFAKSRQQKDVRAVDPVTDEADNDLATGGRTSEDIFEASKSITPGPTKTKDGTVRDSFFKDDTVETKKITLTPNLLRDDGGPRTSSDSKDSKQRPSLDKLEKDSVLGKDDKKKKDKKEKEKKPSAIRSFFSRGGKKKSVDEDDDLLLGKRSMEAISETQGNDGDEIDEAQSPEKTAAPARNPSKLQKQPRTEPSPTRKPSSASRETSIDSYNETRANNVANVPPATMRIVESDGQDSRDMAAKTTNAPVDSSKGSKSKREPKPAVSKVMPSRMQTPEAKPQKSVRAKAAPDPDVVAPAEDVASAEVVRKGSTSSDTTAPKATARQPPKASVSEESGQNVQVGALARDRLTESPVQTTAETSNNPPALMGDTSSQEDHSSPISSPSPELDGDEDGGRRHRKDDSVTTSTSTASTAWNDASLRAYFDSGTEIRDMLTLIYDKTDVAPVGPDHPIAGSLFREQNAKLAEITTLLTGAGYGGVDGARLIVKSREAKVLAGVAVASTRKLEDVQVPVGFRWRRQTH
ncbi:uncharacterized protein PpBr36_06028 [Pyricularia pennisetigena]|uniref:uncharacterized protein n=1 Tax=Pyricularia pennisetigena TaxID=1578925 RepID=UPI001150E347|nr:uncharacterized protein PpBr36_06028 [Pyricularia pennisetigena]TLS22713.1 hypothetical protein PpBr36_06028 [Pyricularia pennisetigena]